MSRNIRLLLFIALGVICVQKCSAGIYYDAVREAVVIDDTITFDPSVFDPAVVDDVTTLRPEGYCVTTGGGQGLCKAIADCYPYYNYMMEEDPNGFIAEIVNSTAPCSGDESGYVCCPNYPNYATLPSKKPLFPQFPNFTPTAPPTTTTVPTTASATVSTSTTVSPPSSTTVKNESVVVSQEKMKSGCGTFLKQMSTDDNVVGGRYTTRGEFPWAVAMTNNGAQFCGGSLFKNNWILTAAHCVQQLRSAAGIRVLIGGHNIGVTETGRESRGVTKILYHRSFAMQHLQNDVALLQLSSPVSYTNYIQPICLETQEVSYPGKVDLAGWGKTGNYAPPSKIQKTVNMNLITPASCKQVYAGTNAPPIHGAGMICAGEKAQGLKDACNGDSGGPLTQKDGGTAKQVGIVSWGIGCGEKPGVYTKVSHYLPWITKNSV